METGTCLHEDVLQIISSACLDFALACQLVELIDAAWHKVEEQEKLTLAAISLFFADKHSWLHALQSVHKGPLLGTLCSLQSPLHLRRSTPQQDFAGRP